MNCTFSVLGWLHRSAAAVGSDRFAETTRRCQFSLNQAASLAATPAERSLIDGLTKTLQAVITADADSRELLDDAISGISETCAAELDKLLETMEGAA